MTLKSASGPEACFTKARASASSSGVVVSFCAAIRYVCSGMLVSLDGERERFGHGGQGEQTYPSLMLRVLLIPVDDLFQSSDGSVGESGEVCVDRVTDLSGYKAVSDQSPQGRPEIGKLTEDLQESWLIFELDLVRMGEIDGILNGSPALSDNADGLLRHTFLRQICIS